MAPTRKSTRKPAPQRTVRRLTVAKRKPAARTRRPSAAFKRPSVGLEAMAYQLPSMSLSVDELHAAGQLISPLAHLKSFGFDRIWIEPEGDHMKLATGAVGQLVASGQLDPDSIDMVIHSGSITPSGMIHDKVTADAPHFLAVSEFLDFFKYPVSKIQYDFEMGNASVAGVGQQSCTSLISALRLARDVLIAEDEVQNVLCVSSDAFPPNAKREVLYNVISDGACAVLLKKGGKKNRFLSYAQITKGYYWNCTELQNEIVAAYFPTARTVIDKALERARLRLDQIDWLLPHNVSLRSWQILLGLLGFPREKFFDANISAKGHSIAADNIVNLRDALDAGLIKPGQNVMLFNYGFGANWVCTVLRA